VSFSRYLTILAIDHSLTSLTHPSFGAVIEEFEVRDGLLALFAEKDGAPARSQFFAPHEVPVYG
jgi:hypothetical protein